MHGLLRDIPNRRERRYNTPVASGWEFGQADRLLPPSARDASLKDCLPSQAQRMRAIIIAEQPIFVIDVPPLNQPGKTLSYENIM
jgi:hypothetical protein